MQGWDQKKSPNNLLRQNNPSIFCFPELRFCWIDLTFFRKPVNISENWHAITLLRFVRPDNIGLDLVESPSCNSQPTATFFLSKIECGGILFSFWGQRTQAGKQKKASIQLVLNNKIHLYAQECKKFSVQERLSSAAFQLCCFLVQGFGLGAIHQMKGKNQVRNNFFPSKGQQNR